ncbi:SigB/SigF/SigG family RNA polymerase sigma factor [Micromonospora sp. NPDC049679]|uniref:SigB/SigF/SigG family RNA polymerase sigma factor n=1 Tax=Micromonospora sp. NPDC049679 TaxID=3155920 RepID=UPI0033F2C281
MALLTARPPDGPTTSATNTVRTVTTSRRNWPAEAAITDQLLRERDQLPAGHPDRVTLRARVIERNLPLAHRLARRYVGRGELFDDLAQVAALALIKAVDGYDHSRRNPFAGYAVPSILGALKRHFRDTAWAMRVPRSSQELAHDVAAATGELSQQRGRSPTPAELAEHLQVSAADVLVAIRASWAYHLASVNAQHPTVDGADVIDLIGGADPHYAEVDDRLSLRPLVEALPLRERRILTMRFFDDMTQTQIAAAVGLSQMHVSRLLKQSLGQLRTRLRS